MFYEVNGRCIVEASTCKRNGIIEEIHCRDQTVFATSQVASKSLLCQERIGRAGAAAKIECFVLTQIVSALPLYKDREEVVMMEAADRWQQWLALAISNTQCKPKICNRWRENFWAFSMEFREELIQLKSLKFYF